MPHSYLLTTRGARTGRAPKNPVLVVEHDGWSWLVAPHGGLVEAYRYVETGQKIGSVVIRCADGGHHAATDPSEA